jgi:hypothetical protein
MEFQAAASALRLLRQDGAQCIRIEQAVRDEMRKGLGSPVARVAVSRAKASLANKCVGSAALSDLSVLRNRSRSMVAANNGQATKIHQYRASCPFADQPYRQ